jgi:hypothetical protein
MLVVAVVVLEVGAVMAKRVAVMVLALLALMVHPPQQIQVLAAVLALGVAQILAGTAVPVLSSFVIQTPLLTPHQLQARQPSRTPAAIKSTDGPARGASRSNGPISHPRWPQFRCLEFPRCLSRECWL